MVSPAAMILISICRGEQRSPVYPYCLFYMFCPYYLCHLRGLADNLFVIVDDFLTAVTIILDFCEICGIILYVKSV